MPDYYNASLEGSLVQEGGDETSALKTIMKSICIKHFPEPVIFFNNQEP